MLELRTVAPRGCIPGAGLSVAVALVLFGLGCPGPSEPDTGGGGDTGHRTDGPVDAVDCSGAESTEACESAPGCYWLTTVCDAGRVASACVPQSASPNAMLQCDGDVEVPGDASDGSGACSGDGCDQDAGEDGGEPSPGDVGGDAPGADGDADVENEGDAADASARCDRFAEADSCRRASGCEWWLGTCDDQVVRQKCISTAQPTPELSCRPVPPDTCRQATRASECSPTSCAWVEEGCGSGSTDSIEVEGCLPDRSCDYDSECPDDHECRVLWVNPCVHDSCSSCGGRVERCVPDSLTP